VNDTKGLLKSKTIAFNSISGLLATAVWPFLPESMRHDPDWFPAVVAWFTIANIVLRLLTTKSVKGWK